MEGRAWTGMDPLDGDDANCSPYYENGCQALWVSFLNHTHFDERSWPQRVVSGKMLVRLRG